LYVRWEIWTNPIQCESIKEEKIETEVLSGQDDPHSTLISFVEYVRRVRVSLIICTTTLLEHFVLARPVATILTVDDMLAL